MTVVNMHEAKTHLAELVRRVLRGETVVIARAGEPLVRLVRLGSAPVPIHPASLPGGPGDRPAAVQVARPGPVIVGAGAEPSPVNRPLVKAHESRWKVFPWGGSVRREDPS